MTHHTTTKLFVTTLVMTSIFVSASESNAQTRRARRPAAATASPTTTTATVPNVDAAAAPIANVSNSGARRAPLNWDAFIDVKAVLPSKEDGVVDRGFSVNDAALYLAKDFSNASAIVDLPFSSTYGSGGANGFAFAQTKAQAYVHMNFGALGVRVGQYDSFFGIEANDSIARFFANQGLLKGTGVTPLTHTGAQLVYSASRFTVRGQVANANGAGTMTDADPEVGVQARFDGGGFFAAVGGEYGTYRTNASDKTNYLFEVLGGMVVNKFTLGAQLDVRKFSGASASGPNTAYPASDKTGFGLGLLGTYEFSDALALGARVDFVKDVNVALAIPPYAQSFNSANAAVDNAFLVSFGPSYKLDQDLTLRADLSIMNAKGANGAGDSTVVSALASIVARL